MLLDLSGIQKCFGGVTALRDGNLRVSAGEVHLLLGENGAGKSTLMKIVAGIERRDAGGMLRQGRAAAFSRPAEAAAAGIAMVHQEPLLAPHLSMAENIFLGREDRLPFGWVRRRRMIEKAALFAAFAIPTTAISSPNMASDMPAFRAAAVCDAMQYPHWLVTLTTR